MKGGPFTSKAVSDRQLADAQAQRAIEALNPTLVTKLSRLSKESLDKVEAYVDGMTERES